MKQHRIRTVWISALLFMMSVLAGCSFSSSHAESISTEQTSSQVSEEFEIFLNGLFQAEVSSNTINLHFTLSQPESFGITETPITLGDISDQAISESHAELENTLAALNRYDYKALSPDQQLTYDILKNDLETELKSADFKFYDEILRPSTGIQAQLPVLYEEYKFYDEDDIKNYLKLIELTDSYFDQIIEYEQKKADAGLFMADFACDNIISQCEDFTANPDGHYLIQTFNNKIDRMPELSDPAREDYKAQNEVLIKEHVLPAYQKLADAMNKLLGRGKNDKGLKYLKNGRDYYEYLVYCNTGSPSSVKELQTMVADQRMNDLTEAADLINKNPSLWEEANQVSLDNGDSIATLNILQKEMLKQFPKAPETEFTVSYIDECMEDYMAPAFYITAPIDNYNNNSIFINASTDTSTMHYFTTLAHEGFPGHLYQTVMSYESGMEPVRSILNYPGYVEGWATYVEMISYQYAGLKEDVAKMLSLNQSALLSLYADTDIGIHYEGWSFDDTLAFWTEYGISDAESIRDVYELIVEEPSHYLKYYIGYLEFLNLKKEAKETYGSNYSDVAFHQAVLNIGPAPFEIVGKYLDRYYVAED